MEKTPPAWPCRFASHVSPPAYSRNLWVTLHVSAAPAAVSRPERSDRVSEEAQFPGTYKTDTGRADVAYCPLIKSLYSLIINYRG